jgi:hypothetical protein
VEVLVMIVRRYLKYKLVCLIAGAAFGGTALMTGFNVVGRGLLRGAQTMGQVFLVNFNAHPWLFGPLALLILLSVSRRVLAGWLLPRTGRSLWLLGAGALVVVGLRDWFASRLGTRARGQSVMVPNVGATPPAPPD